MKSPVSPKYLTHCSFSALPNAPGVVLIICKSNGRYEYVDHMKCDNIRNKVDSLSGQRPYAYDGELTYWICTDPAQIEEAWKEAVSISRL